uniref:Uncharacterized protein n=1 Tax=mine drainage metagenome TaxID=410659 RepID=E6Q6R9_9ZZZZ
MGPRRYRRGNAKSSASSSSSRALQWGRDVIVAEIIPGFVDLDVLNGASMGPRRYRRGNIEARCRPSDFSSLQWGRDVIVAEIRQ